MLRLEEWRMESFLKGKLIPLQRSNRSGGLLDIDVTETLAHIELI